MVEIRNAVVIFTLKEVEAMLTVNGLPLNHQSIHDLLWVSLFNSFKFFIIII